MHTSTSSSTTTETIVASTPAVTAPPAPERKLKTEIKTEIKSEEKSELKTEGKPAPLTLAQLHRMASSLEAPRSGTSLGSRYVGHRPASYRPQTLAEALLPVQDEKKVAVETVPALVSSIPATVEDITPAQTTPASYRPRDAKKLQVPTKLLQQQNVKKNQVKFRTNPVH